MIPYYLTIKNLRATVSSNKVYPNCTTSAEGIIKEVYGSTVYFNDFQGGSNTTINFAIHEAVDTNSLTEIEKVFAEQNISPLRWAIVKLDGETMFLNIVFNKT